MRIKARSTTIAKWERGITPITFGRRITSGNRGIYILLVIQAVVDYPACCYIHFQGDVPLRSSGSEIETTEHSHSDDNKFGGELHD